MPIFVRFLLVCLLLSSNLTKAESQHRVTEVEFKGLRFTDPAWLKAYLPLNCPCLLSDDKIRELQSKLLTTQVFQTVHFSLQSISESAKKLTLDVQEKWTVIPVLRGAYGGGTPLVVAGLYDSHVNGSLWTLGAETRTYGSSPTGGVIWFRAPRWKEGSHYLNFEVWRDNRVRSLYDHRDQAIAAVYGSALAIHADYLLPIPSLSSSFQLGMRLQYRDQQDLDWDGLLQSNEGLETLNLEKESTKTTLVRMIYDNVSVSQINLNGFRFLLSGGPVYSEKKTRLYWEQETFYYKLWPNDWNLAFHQFLSLTSSKSYQSLTFLGGFDSIRGIPDGVLVGNKAIYGNLELRKLFYRSQYSWLQSAIYVDHGSAALTASELSESGRSSFGVGLRLAVPQVHRLMFRLDYAWSLDRPGTSSVSAGLNQFIDPYRPL